MQQLLSNAGMLDAGLKEACNKVFNACNICTSSGGPHHKKKLSFSRVFKSFNEEVQADFTAVYFGSQKKMVVHIVGVGTN